MTLNLVLNYKNYNKNKWPNLHKGDKMLCELQATYPELYEEEGILWSFAKKLFQPSFLLWEFVINLTDVHRLQQGIAVGVICLSDVYK